jgi:RNA polymerase sigma-70 factor (ECF subfamily)
LVVLLYGELNRRDDMNELVKQMTAGDTEAFCDIVKVYEKNIYCYLYRLCGNREDALDLTQDTFLKAYANLHRFNINMDFKPWIYRIAHNNFINHIKSKKEYMSLESEELPDYNTPENIAILKDCNSSIDHIVSELPYKYRFIFLLRVLDDLSFKEIGSILKISESNARMRYLRVRKKISEALEGEDLL